MYGTMLRITADYRDGLVYVSGKKYPAGYFAVRLLNQYYKNDIGARVSVFRSKIWPLQKSMKQGYIYEPEFLAAGENILYMLKSVPMLPPYNTLMIESERERIRNLFTTETAKKITDYWQRRSAVHTMDLGRKIFGHMPKEYDEELFDRVSRVVDEITETLNFYEQFGTHTYNAFHRLQEFVRNIDTVKRFDEGHLLPYALEIFGPVPFHIFTEPVEIKKNARSSTATLARKMYFDNFYSFVVTDFFEGLHYGHYPRQCEICKKYFLMTSARRQKYCLGKAPEKLNGKTVSCRKYAAAINRKELAQDDPIASLYTKRCTAIRTEKGRGTITAEFAECAKRLAKEHKYRAYEDDEYAKVQYAADMERVKLYADTDRQLQS